MNVLFFENELLVGGYVGYIFEIVRVVCEYIVMYLRVIIELVSVNVWEI